MTYKLKINDSIIELPSKLLEKIKGKELEVLELGEIIILKPAGINVIQEAKGFLKNKKYSFKKYIKQKRIDKDIGN